MSGSSYKMTSSEKSPPLSDIETVNVKKKSILLNPEYKRGSSKATIQWEETVKGQRLEERMRHEKRSRLHALGHFMSHGSKWSYIQELMTKLKVEEGKIFKNTRISEESSQGRTSPRRIDSLVRELWHGMLQKTIVKGGDLSLNQQTKLELMKHKVKADNDKYLKRHPELDILLSLVYRKLIRTKPNDPKVFVANYVHYLNTHREELVLDEVDVPFDVASGEIEESDEDMMEERQEIEVFVQDLVQKCAELASCGSAVANVTNIIDSMLENIDTPKEEDITSTVRSAENAARGILMSMLTSVARARTHSVELVVEDILGSVFDSVCPSVSRDSEDLIEARESVENFVKSLLKTVTDKFARQLRRQDRLNRFEQTISGEEGSFNGDADLLSITSKSILKKLIPPPFGLENQKPTDKPEFKSKVKFQSVSGVPSKETSLKKNSND